MGKIQDFELRISIIVVVVGNIVCEVKYSSVSVIVLSIGG
jgi:hypothetical protein